jgi:hypothetical protein
MPVTGGRGDRRYDHDRLQSRPCRPLHRMKAQKGTPPAGGSEPHDCSTDPRSPRRQTNRMPNVLSTQNIPLAPYPRSPVWGEGRRTHGWLAPGGPGMAHAARRRIAASLPSDVTEDNVRSRFETRLMMDCARLNVLPPTVVTSHLVGRYISRLRIQG